MIWNTITVLVASLLLELTHVTEAKDSVDIGKTGTASQALEQEKDDLKTAASNAYPDRYSDWNRGYSSGYGVTGYGSLDDRYGGYRGYDNGYGYIGYDGDYSRQGSGYFESAGYGGNKGGYGGYSGSSGYGGYGVNAGSSYGGYGVNAGSGYGGYGGYAGSGGLNSYYGYNNPNYQGGNNHLGYGYYKRPGYGNIYNSGITPSLVTGYRGYSRR